MPTGELAGQVALVTGAARNIGRAIALALAGGGAAVVVNARNESDELAETVRLVEAAGGEALAVAADVTDGAAVKRMIDAAVARFGRLDALVNNAAVRVEQPFDAIAFDDWRRIVSIVLDGAFLCSQAALSHLRRAGGGSMELVAKFLGNARFGGLDDVRAQAVLASLATLFDGPLENLATLRG